MNRNPKASRRAFLMGTGAAVASSLFLRDRRLQLFPPARAQAAVEKSGLLVVFLRGGYNALFTSADSFQPAGTFGVTGTNVLPLSNGVVVDKATIGTLPPAVLAQLAAVGVKHGISSHDNARNADWNMGSRSYALMLANAMGGDAAIKAVALGSDMPEGSNSPEGGVSLQKIQDTASTIAALGGAGTADPTIPDRTAATGGLGGSLAMSDRSIMANPASLKSMGEGYRASIEALGKPVQSFNYGEMASAYGLSATATSVSSMKSKFLAAELMLRAGANVVTAIDSSAKWDTHGDTSGAKARANMTSTILPGLSVFLNRTLAMTDRNVVTVILGDFARSLPGSDHAKVLSATVFGKYVRQGTTGRVDASVGLPVGTPSVPGLWAYLAKLLKTPSEPFGPNPHGLVL